MRYQIVYCKHGFPLTTWANTADRARQLADQLRRAGYSVDVWYHTADGSRKTDLCPPPDTLSGPHRKATPPHYPGSSREIIRTYATNKGVLQHEGIPA